ncbi:hypothetical protein ACG2LH_13665 [Zhouia sp. PK063]|uniref:hypothetical protein n=1 Tax=Zhouia sp. PK063 TaxID=3373602 RepID=UPI0037B254BE
MRFLIIVQDLRVSGTSEGIVSRSFIAKLRRGYPEIIIDVLYLSKANTPDNLELLPIDSITRQIINTKIPFHVKWINRFSTRLFNKLYADNYIHKQYAKHIKKVDHHKYDYIFVRSSGLNHETILAMHGLPILKKAIINFHDPYPYPWYDGKIPNIHKNEFLRLRKMIEVVQQAKACCASAYYMAKDLQYLYASDKYFYTLPHQFAFEAFDLDKKEYVRKKQAKFQISYHGALMFGRNIVNVLEAYVQLIHEDENIAHHTEFVLRVKGDGITQLKEKYSTISNIHILDCLDFSNSANEQLYESDINIILENGPYYSNILGGKVPFLEATKNAIFLVSPERSELRKIVENEFCIADMHSIEDIKMKLQQLIADQATSKKEINVFGNYFSNEHFKFLLDQILND